MPDSARWTQRLGGHAWHDRALCRLAAGLHLVCTPWRFAHGPVRRFADPA